MHEKLLRIFGQGVEEIDLFGNVREHLGALLQERGDRGGIIRLVLDALADVRLCHGGECLRAHRADILAVEVAQLLNVEYGGGFGYAGYVEYLLHLVEGIYLPLAARTPPQQRHIVEHRVRQKALRDEILIRRVAVALGHFIMCVAHDGGAVDVLGYLPAEALVQQVILRRGGEILAAAHDVRDAHEMVVHDIGKVVRRQTVALYEHLIVERGVLHGNVAEYLVMERRRPLVGDALAYDIGLALGGEAVALLLRQRAAGVVPAVKLARVLLALRPLAEAAVGVPARNEQLGIFPVERAALGLDIRSDRTANVGPLVMLKMALRHSAVNYIHRALNEPPLIGVLDAQDELPAVSPRDKVGIERGTQVADVHISRGGGGKTGAHLAVRYARLHLLKPLYILHFNFLRSAARTKNAAITIIFYLFTVVKTDLFCYNR